jgi:hypothetical protein
MDQHFYFSGLWTNSSIYYGPTLLLPPASEAAACFRSCCSLLQPAAAAAACCCCCSLLHSEAAAQQSTHTSTTFLCFTSASTWQCRGTARRRTPNHDDALLSHSQPNRATKTLTTTASPSHTTRTCRAPQSSAATRPVSQRRSACWDPSAPRSAG